MRHKVAVSQSVPTIPTFIAGDTVSPFMFWGVKVRSYSSISVERSFLESELITSSNMLSRVQSGPLAQCKEVALLTTCFEDCTLGHTLGILAVHTLGILAVEGDSVHLKLECQLPIQFLFVLTLVHQQVSLLSLRWPPHFHCSRSFPNARYTTSIFPTAPVLRLHLQLTAPLPTTMFVILGVC